MCACVCVHMLGCPVFCCAVLRCICNRSHKYLLAWGRLFCTTLQCGPQNHLLWIIIKKDVKRWEENALWCRVCLTVFLASPVSRNFMSTSLLRGRKINPHCLMPSHSRQTQSLAGENFPASPLGRFVTLNELISAFEFSHPRPGVFLISQRAKAFRKGSQGHDPQKRHKSSTRTLKKFPPKGNKKQERKDVLISQASASSPRTSPWQSWWRLIYFLSPNSQIEAWPVSCEDLDASLGYHSRKQRAGQAQRNSNKEAKAETWRCDLNKSPVWIWAELWVSPFPELLISGISYHGSLGVNVGSHELAWGRLVWPEWNYLTSILDFFPLCSRCLFACLLFQDRVSLCNGPGCPGTHFVDQAGLELTEIHQNSASHAVIKGMCHHCPASSSRFSMLPSAFRLHIWKCSVSIRTHPW
jgi:hypothetical protein